MSQNVITETNLTNLDPANRGKVRDLYDLGEELLIISTDRISAFDVVLPNGIPYKGQILTGLSEFWFDHTKSIVDNHVISTDVSQISVRRIASGSEVLKGRSMLVRKANRIDIECCAGIYRGFCVVGVQSGWNGVREKLPPGLTNRNVCQSLSSRLPRKRNMANTMRISQSRRWRRRLEKSCQQRLSRPVLRCLKPRVNLPKSPGIILCDTKFEFGQIDGSTDSN